ncbi:MAG: hypothetical protein IPN47_22095 [Gemmatimonadetes bacterium]|nr:hypothetical protein [Gemmatimonadota bacterium]
MEHHLGPRTRCAPTFDVALCVVPATASSTNPSGSYEVVNTGNILSVNGRYRFADIPSDVFRAQLHDRCGAEQVDPHAGLYGVFVEDR